jgi:hypothetical protein
VKSISLSVTEGFSELFYDPLANVAVICDTLKGCVYPFFLNLYKSKNFKAKAIQLDSKVDQTYQDSNEPV